MHIVSFVSSLDNWNAMLKKVVSEYMKTNKIESADVKIVSVRELTYLRLPIPTRFLFKYSIG